MISVKHVMIAMIIGVSMIGRASFVEAEVDTPMKASFELYGQFKIVKGQERVWGWSSYQKLGLIDLHDGEHIESLYNGGSSIMGFDTTDDQSRCVVLQQGVIHVYNTFGTKTGEIKTIFNEGEEISDFSEVRFIPDTHLLVLIAKNDGNGRLLTYDLDSNQVVNIRETNRFGQILTAYENVAIVSSSDVHLYGIDLTDKGVIQTDEDEEIEAFDMSDDGFLILGKYGNPQLDVYDVNRGYRHIQTNGQFVTEKDISYNDIAIDESGEFVAVTSSGGNQSFSLFERTTGRRIHTALDKEQDLSYQSNVELSNGAHSIIVEGYSRTNVYSGKQLYKRPVAIQIPKARQSVEMGTSETLSLEVTRADGKTMVVKSDVDWTIDDPEKASIDSGKLYGKAQGTYTLKATYEGFTTTVTGRVTQPARLSSLKDVPWLQRQRQSLLNRQSFEGMPVLSSSYSKLSGIEGNMFIPKTKVSMNGKWNESVLISQSEGSGKNQPNQIQRLTLLPELEQRSISKSEIASVFGKPVTSKIYSPPVSRYFSKVNKVFAKYTVKNVYGYHLKNLSVEIYFDKKDIARFIIIKKR